jgi:hypothetical protein
MLGWAGFPGTFGGSNSEVAVSSDDEEWHAFLVALHDAFSTESCTVKDLVDELRDPFLGGRIDAAALPGDLADKWSHIREGRDEGFRKSLGWWLKNREGRYASGWSLVVAEVDGHSKAPRYVVKPPTDPNLRGLRGFDPATREEGNGHLVITAAENGQEKSSKPGKPAAEAGGIDVLAVRQGTLTRRLLQRMPATQKPVLNRGGVMSCRGRIATDRLTMRLIQLARQGIRPGCGDAETSHYWTAESEQLRHQALAWCDGCLAWQECREAAEANHTTWSVYAGKDYSIRPGQ